MFDSRAGVHTGTERGLVPLVRMTAACCDSTPRLTSACSGRRCAPPLMPAVRPIQRELGRRQSVLEQPMPLFRSYRSIASALLLLAALVSVGVEARASDQSRGQSDVSVQVEDVDGFDRIRTGAFQTPCLSASVLPSNNNPARLSEAEFSNRVELRMRAASLRPVRWERETCPLPDSRETRPGASGPALAAIALGVTAYINPDGTFSVDLSIFRVVEWRTGAARGADDGRRAAVLKVDSDREPSFDMALRRTPELRHEGSPAAVLAAVDRLLDRFLVRYLKANQ